MVARLGGDEFVVVQTGVRGKEQAEAFAHRIAATLSEPMYVQGARNQSQCDDRRRAGANATARPPNACSRAPISRSITAKPPDATACGSSRRKWTRHCRPGIALEIAIRACNGERRIRSALSTRVRNDPQSADRIRGAGAVAAKGRHVDSAGRIHSGGRGHAPHRQTRSLGAAQGVSDRDIMAERPEHCGQPVAGAIRVWNNHRSRRRRAEGVGAGPRIGSSWKSSRHCCLATTNAPWNSCVDLRRSASRS